MQAAKEEYKEKDLEPDIELIIEFESDRITLDIPLEGISLDGGWNIRPLTQPVVSLDWSC